MQSLVLFFVFIFAASSFGATKTLVCTIRPLSAGPEGFVLSHGTAEMQSVVHKDLRSSQKYCMQVQSQLQVRRSMVSLCAFDGGDMEGDYQVFLDVGPVNAGRLFTASSTKVFRVSPRTRNLVEVWGNHMLSSEVAQKLSRAGVELPDFTDEQFAVYEQAVAKGVQSGILKNGELAAVILEQCSFAK